MIYIQHDRLALVEVNNKENKLSFDILAKVILERPSNTIYFESDGKLYGILSMGDIARASEKGDSCVEINRKFIQISPNDAYRTAKRIFQENKKINELPIVDEDNKILGSYTRWDDLYNRNMFSTGKIEPLYKNYSHIVFVRPCEMFRARYNLFRDFYDYMLSLGEKEKLENISFCKVTDYFDIADLILFTCEDEIRAIETYVRYILRKEFPKKKLKTYRDWIQELKIELKYEFIREYLCDIMDQGVHVLNLNFGGGGGWQWGAWYHNVWKPRLINKYSVLGEEISDVMPSALWPQFFDELYTEKYANTIMHLPFSIETGNHNGKLKDCNGKFYNVINGERCTVGQPEKYYRTIYFIGPCFIYGHYVEDKNTIESFLQKHINKVQNGIRVVNCGSPISGQMDLELAQIKELPLKKADCLVIYIDNKSFPDIPELDLAEILEKYDVSEYWMVDHPAHCNHKMNALYAEAIYNKLKPVLVDSVNDWSEKIKTDEDFVKTIYIDRHFDAFDPLVHGKIGSIVMNCNPFTLGHRYLIDEALKTVDFLILFVVEEDKSVFSFDERFSMVYEGTKDLSNVKVVPSGPFILSRTTFPEYFIKEADEDIVRNVENDVILFAEKIAPELNIRYRFVGEEPEDMVTNEYNSAMKRILPGKGIELVEIPRKKINEQYVSASLVRKYIEDFNTDKLYELVPETTWKILFPEDC